MIFFPARLKLNRPLVLLLIVFVALALCYSFIIPLFEGPDEDDHFRFAKFLADQRALPVQLFEAGGGAAGHQGWQPPLYYALAAALITPIDTSDYAQHLWRNYGATFLGDPACCGRNIYYHTDSENFPFTRTTLAVHLARLLSIVFGAITVWATYHLTTAVLGNSLLASHHWLALAAAAFVAFNPSFLFASALVSNDAALAAFSSLTVLVWIKLLNAELALTGRAAAGLGALIGLALLTKTTALGLVPLSMLVLSVMAWRKRDARLAFTANAIMLAMILALAGWWFARNLVLYGDPLALKLVSASALFPRSGPLTPAEFFQISLPWLWQTFWGGPTPGDFAPLLLVGLAGLFLIALIGIVLFTIRNSQATIRFSFFILAAWLGFILAAQFQFIQTTVGADQGRYLFPTLGALSLFFVAGWAEITRRVFRNSQFAMRSLPFIVMIAFFALALFVLVANTLPAYARPALASETELARATHPVQFNFANQLELRGYDLDTRIVQPGDAVRLTLYWRALAAMPESYRVFAHLVGPNDRSGGGVDVIPARGAFPTVYWKPGDALRDVISIPVAATSAPGKYDIEIGLYPVGKPNNRVPVLGSDDDRAVLGAIKIVVRETAALNPQNRMSALFGNQIELMGYDLAKDQNPAQGLKLVLYWRARAIPVRDYTVFVHALDANGKIIAQIDQQPQAGNNPTSLWGANENVRDAYDLALPAGVSAQRIEIGLYRADTGARLPVAAGASGAANSDRVIINAEP